MDVPVFPQYLWTSLVDKGQSTLFLEHYESCPIIIDGMDQSKTNMCTIYKGNSKICTQLVEIANTLQAFYLTQSVHHVFAFADLLHMIFFVL